jgi:branched-chain amino acid transport system permease protein
MSPELLLGYTGQLESRPTWRSSASEPYASALTTLGFDVELFGDFRVVHEPWPAVIGFFVAHRLPD